MEGDRSAVGAAFRIADDPGLEAFDGCERSRTAASPCGSVVFAIEDQLGFG
jgi:hypothetical protein